jgi:molybdopterin converting factor subunit 1
MTPIRVRLFARARDLVGADYVDVPLAEGATVAELRVRLAAAYPALRALLRRAAVAVNEDFAGDSARIPPEADVALLPPVSGG